MTDMRRMTISMPDDLDKRILEQRKDDRFIRQSYSEVVRQLLEIGLEAMKAERAKDLQVDEACHQQEARAG